MGDVHHLFAMRDRWGAALPTAHWRAVSEKRMLNQIKAATFAAGAQRSLKDFAFTEEWVYHGVESCADSVAPALKTPLACSWLFVVSTSLVFVTLLFAARVSIS